MSGREATGADRLEPGSVLAGCRIERLIGQGGMGTVYLARQLELDRDVALKVMNPGLAGDEGFGTRFRAETRLAARVEHPNVVPLYEAGEEEGVVYMLMRYVAGRDLGVLLGAEGALEPRRAVGLIAQTAAGLDAVHATGLVHRDLKPANVLVTAGSGTEHAYITDFGLAKRAASFSGPTKIGHFVGTLDYIAPEQLIGNPVDARADVYALGCLLYELLTGRVPYPRDDSAGTMWAHVKVPPPAPSEHGGSALVDFDELIARGMAKKPEDRFPSAGDLGRAASAIAAGRRPAEREGSVATGRAAPTTIGSAPRPTLAPGEGAGAPAPPPPTRAASAPDPADGGRRLAPAVSALIAAVLALAAVAGLAFAGLFSGQGDDPEPPDPPVTGAGPAGTLEASGIGEVQVGDTQERVEELFGPPADRVRNLIARSGAGLEGTNYEIWVYELEDADSSEDSIRLYFENPSTELFGYSAVTELLETEEGVSVGDNLNQLRGAYGGLLERGPGGFQTQGSFIVRGEFEMEYPALVFTNQLGSVSSIEGGDPPPFLGGFAG